MAVCTVSAIEDHPLDAHTGGLGELADLVLPEPNVLVDRLQVGPIEPLSVLGERLSALQDLPARIERYLKLFLGGGEIDSGHAKKSARMRRPKLRDSRSRLRDSRSFWGQEENRLPPAGFRGGGR